MQLTTIIGLLAATCTTIAYIPQALKTIREKKTKDLSLVMYVILTTGISLWLIYGIMIKDYPIIIANALSLIFTSTILFFIIKYNQKKKK